MTSYSVPSLAWEDCAPTVDLHEVQRTSNLDYIITDFLL